MDALVENIEQMLLVDPAKFSKEFDRDASVLVFDKAFDNAEQFTLWYYILKCHKRLFA